MSKSLATNVTTSNIIQKLFDGLMTKSHYAWAQAWAASKSPKTDKMHIYILHNEFATSVYTDLRFGRGCASQSEFDMVDLLVTVWENTENI